MKRALLLAAALSAAYLSHGAHAGTLCWNNGESMTGELIEATGTTATWKSPFFENPVVLAWPVIHRMDWPVTSAAPVTDPFMISLRDGSSIYGDVVAVTGSS